MKIDPYYSHNNVAQRTRHSFWRYKVYLDIHCGSLQETDFKRQWMVENGYFRAFDYYILGTYSDLSYCLSLIPKQMALTFNDLE